MRSRRLVSFAPDSTCSRNGAARRRSSDRKMASSLTTATTRSITSLRATASLPNSKAGTSSHSMRLRICLWLRRSLVSHCIVVLGGRRVGLAIDAHLGQKLGVFFHIGLGAQVSHELFDGFLALLSP